MPLLTYKQTRPWAAAIREAALARTMPPWFADARFGRFANDRSLTGVEIETLSAWARTGAIEGDVMNAPPAREWTEGWNIPPPDLVLETPNAFAVPSTGTVEYQQILVPTGFKEDKWVRAVEVRPGHPEVVHHIVVYVRERGSKWAIESHFTTSDVLAVYTPGNSPDVFPEGLAKLIPAGAGLVFQIHYTPNGHACDDRIRIGLVFQNARPAKRVITLQMGNDHFAIPPGDPDYRVSVGGTLPNEAILLSLFPHMHLRGKRFEYTAMRPGQRPEILLSIEHYNFHWQLAYRLTRPLTLPKGTRIQCVAHFDNSANNPLNPDPAAEVRYGEQSWEEMMIGFFDVAVDAAMGKEDFFVRRSERDSPPSVPLLP